MGQKNRERPFFARIANRSNSYDTPPNSDGERFLRDFCTKGNLLIFSINWENKSRWRRGQPLRLPPSSKPNFVKIIEGGKNLSEADEQLHHNF